MKRITAPPESEEIVNVLEKIEEREEHDKGKVKKAVERLENRGGIAFQREGQFDIVKNKATYVAGVASTIMVGEMKTSMNGEMYVVGRDPENPTKVVYYKAENGEIKKRDAGNVGNQYISRLDLVIIPAENSVEIFNIGANKAELELDIEAEF